MEHIYYELEFTPQEILGIVYEAILEDNLEIVKEIGEQVSNWENIRIDWRTNNIEIIQYLESKMVLDWKRVLMFGAGYGKIKMIKYAIEKGATNYDDGIATSFVGQQPIATFFLVQQKKLSQEKLEMLKPSDEQFFENLLG